LYLSTRVCISGSSLISLDQHLHRLLVVSPVLIPGAMSVTMDNMSFKNDAFPTWLADTDYTGPLGVVVKLYVKQEFREPFVKGMEAKMAKIRGEEGVRTYKLNEDVLDPLVFWLTEEWESVAALRKHIDSQHHKETVEWMADLLQDPPFCQLAVIKLCTDPGLSI